MKTILLAGCGKMGTAMLTGWLEGLEEDLRFIVVDPMLAEGHPLGKDERVSMLSALPPDWGQLGLGTFESGGPDMVVLAVKPQMMAEALPPLVACSREDTVWLSIAAGISIAWLREAISSHAATAPDATTAPDVGADPDATTAPDAPIIRTMPNTPAAIGRGMTAMIATENTPADMHALARRMLEVTGQVVGLDDEADMDAVTAVSGSGPAYVFLLREALEAAGVSAGLKPELAGILAAQTISGAADLLDASDESPSQLRINVTSPGGTTQAALEVLMAQDGLPDLLRAAVLAARDRSRTLGN